MPIRVVMSGATGWVGKALIPRSLPNDCAALMLVAQFPGVRAPVGDGSAVSGGCGIRRGLRQAHRQPSRSTMTIQFKALPTADVRRLQRGGPDAYGFAPERQTSDGDGVPCRHCLRTSRPATTT